MDATEPKVVGLAEASKMLNRGPAGVTELANAYLNAKAAGYIESEIAEPYLKPMPRGSGKTCPWRFAVSEIDAHIARELSRV